jgi:putative ABC transport system substrate-binding protein
MRLIGLAVILTLGFILEPLAVEPQTASKVPRIGWLGNMAPPPPAVNQLDGFLQGLNDLGYVEGQNVVIEYRWAEGRLDRLPALAQELARLRVDVMMVAGVQGYDAAKRASGTTPIVVAACDPLEHLVGSIAHPAGNATGITCISSELATKRLELLKDVAPKVIRVGALYNPGDVNKPLELRQLQTTAAAVGMRIEPFEVMDAAGFDPAFAAMRRGRMQAIITLADPLMNFYRARIATLAAEHRLPAIYGFREYVDAGGLMSYGASLSETFRRAASYIDKILKGARPGDLPVEQPTKFELVINLKTAKALGLPIPQTLLQRADQVIE